MFANFKFKKATEPTDLDIEIARLLQALKDMQPTDSDYDSVSDQYVKLSKLNSETTSKRRVSPDTLAGAATNLLGILFILNYEHAHVFTSKAASFVVKNIKS